MTIYMANRRRRNLLHINKLEEFKMWLQEHGWKECPVKGAYEVLRMRHPNEKPPLLIYTRVGKEHLTVYGKGIELVYMWLEDRE